MEQNTSKKTAGIRWLYLGAGFILLLLLGLIYAWSIFVAPLENEFGWNRSETSMAFTVCLCMFCIGGLVAGFLQKKKKPTFIIWLCAVFVLAGFVLSARINTLIGLYICYGGFVGFGVGLAYNAIISTVTKWFPDKTGFISGLLLMGFGFGGMVLGTASTALIGKFGWRATFTAIGIVFFVVILFLSFLIKAPTADAVLPAAKAKAHKQEEGQDFTTREMLSTKSFWLFFMWAVVLTAAGLALIGHASPNAIDMGASVATAAFYSGLISVSNGLGRVIVGIIFDKLGRKRTMLMISAGFIISGLLLTAALRANSMALLVAVYVLTGLFYGGVMPCNSTVIGEFFGRKHYAMNFSMINMNILLASVLGPYLAGILQGLAGSYQTTFIAMSVYGLLAVVFTLLISRPKAKKSKAESTLLKQGENA